MAQPYTVKQLDYFRSMLVILETAMVKAKPGTSEKAAAPLPEPLFVPLPADVYEQFAAANTASATTENVATDANPKEALTPEAAVSSSAFFETLPWLAGDDAAPVAAPVAVLDVAVDVAVAAVVVASDANTKTCAAFFQALPWQTADDAPVSQDKASVVASEAVIATVANTKTSSAFFRALPWQTAADAPVLQAQATADVVAETLVAPAISLVNTQTCSAFFQALPWEKAAVAPVVADAVVDKTAQPSLANKQTCSAFFQALPWETGKALPAQKMDLVAAMASNDITAIANLATQSAIQSAQRGVQQNSPAARPVASAFFQSLPW
jgi:hypothetical protein